MLSEWAFRHHAWKKGLAWRLYQRADLEAAAGFHATSEKEAEEIRARGFTQPIAVVPNGVESPRASAARRGPKGARRVALFMSRLHPNKGALDLIAGWARVKPCCWELWLAGPDESGHRAVLEREVDRLWLSQEVRFLGEVGEGEKWDVFAQADLFVLPSHDENYGVVVAEALAAGVPVITTTGTPWKEVERLGAGWLVTPGVGGVTAALEAACALREDELRAMGEHGRSWARTALSWPGVSTRMRRFYEWLLGGRHETPAWVWT
jgi:glycosyltransferase involved in cell wall biosynthesis